MENASLSDIPGTATEVEDYVAALFQSAGYFVEKNVVEADVSEVLELDLIATDYRGPRPSHVLAEAKSGDWGFSELFKVVGWMRYLEIQTGGFFVAKAPDDNHAASIAKRMKPLGLAVVDLGDFSQATTRFAEAGFSGSFDTISVSLWRFAYAIERTLITKLRARAKSEPGLAGPSAALEHYRLVNNELFFVKDARDRLFKLYDAYMTYPKMSLSIALELGGATFDASPSNTRSDLLTAALRYGKHDVLQACLYLEHRARLSILKAAIDYRSQTGQPLARPKLQKPTLVAPDLPSTFYGGIDKLQGNASFSRYALLWQIFLWGFGGFYLEDRRDTEFDWLAKQSGVPVDEIPAALSAFDLLFPIPNGWFTRAGNTQCVILKMVPPAFRGLGANHRLWRYAHNKWEDFDSGDYTVKDLANWNNIVYRLLASK